MKFIDKILHCIKSIDNLRALEDLIDFCSNEKIEMDDLVFENVQLTDLRCSLEAKHLCNRVTSRPKSQAELRTLLEIILNLLNQGWNFSQLSEFIDLFNLQGFAKFQNLIHILSTIHKYSLSASSNFEKCKQILIETKSFQESIRKFNKLAIENNFQLEGKIKDLNELLSELKKSNAFNPSVVKSVDNGSLRFKLEQVKSEAFCVNRELYNTEMTICNWNEKLIYLWSAKMKTYRMDFSDEEAIAVIKQANFLITGHTLTDTQILCSLIALQCEDNLRGRLLEVATGEGKSTIVCILAIINCLRGKQVHVITSSPVLAERDAKQKAKLFRMSI